MKIPKRQYTEFGEVSKEIIKIDSSELFEIENKTLEDAKERTKYIKLIESYVRGSMEYRNYIGYLKNHLNLTKCKFFKNIDVKNTKVSLEMHHYPFTLYDIVDVVVEKYIKTNTVINEFDIAEEVMRLHYENKVGLVPLTKTAHELAHEGQLFLPSTFVTGCYKSFIKEYDKYIMEVHRQYVNTIESQTRKIMEGTIKFNTDIIKRKTIEIEDASCDKTKDLYVDIDDPSNNTNIV